MQTLLKLWGTLPIPPWVRWALVSLFVPKFAVGVVGVMFNAQGEILLFHHTYRGRYPWGLPSGWLNPYEDPAHGIVREIQEETSLEVRALRPVLVENDPLVRRVDLTFLCELARGEFRPSDEVNAMQFFSRDALPDMLRSQRSVIEKIFQIMDEGILPR